MEKIFLKQALNVANSYYQYIYYELYTVEKQLIINFSFVYQNKIGF